MSSLKSKKTFLILSITLPFLLYCFYYYGMMVKNAPYKFSEFDSMQIQFGYRDSLLNKYDSKTGEYQYINKKDSVVKMHMRLTNDDLLYLHRKAADLGFWDFPAKELSNDSTVRAPRYIITFRYKRKTKSVVFDANYTGPEKLVDANQRLIKEIKSRLGDAQQRLKK
jgi:hypothetical protein